MAATRMGQMIEQFCSTQVCSDDTEYCMYMCACSKLY